MCTNFYASYIEYKKLGLPTDLENKSPGRFDLLGVWYWKEGNCNSANGSGIRILVFAECVRCGDVKENSQRTAAL